MAELGRPGLHERAIAESTLPVQLFFIATPPTPVLAIDAALALGKNLILEPGVYDLQAPTS